MQILSLLTKCSELFTTHTLLSGVSEIISWLSLSTILPWKKPTFSTLKSKIVSTKTTLFFFSLLNKSKYLREWVSLKDLSKSRRGMKILCFPQFFFWKRNFLFSVHYFTLIETQPTFKTAELLRTNLDWIRLPRDIVKEIMKGYKLEETIWKERKKEKDWGKKWGLLQYGGKQTKILLFPSLRPNAKRKREEWEQGSDKSDLHRLPSILIFWTTFLVKE